MELRKESHLFIIFFNYLILIMHNIIIYQYFFSHETQTTIKSLITHFKQNMTIRLISPIY